ncbi:hypothetical protein HanIR_Chr08g0365541 [Helianthus annuus]|nr:hypothetical protein HanIR_Chr08g0365541 [Helianthus annuus]
MVILLLLAGLELKILEFKILSPLLQERLMVLYMKGPSFPSNQLNLVLQIS